MQKQDGRQIGLRLQPTGQPTQLRTTQQSGRSARFLRIESDQTPVLEALFKYKSIVEDLVGLRKNLMQRSSLIVVSRNDPQPLAPIRQFPPYGAVGWLDFVMRRIPRDHQQVSMGNLLAHRMQCRLESRPGRDAAQLHFKIGEEVAIRYLNNRQAIHRGLPKYVAARVRGMDSVSKVCPIRWTMFSTLYLTGHRVHSHHATP